MLGFRECFLWPIGYLLPWRHSTQQACDPEYGGEKKGFWRCRTLRIDAVVQLIVASMDDVYHALSLTDYPRQGGFVDCSWKRMNTNDKYRDANSRARSKSLIRDAWERSVRRISTLAECSLPHSFAPHPRLRALDWSQAAGNATGTTNPLAGKGRLFH